jgi:hypothetical protein
MLSTHRPAWQHQLADCVKVLPEQQKAKQELPLLRFIPRTLCCFSWK